MMKIHVISVVVPSDGDSGLAIAKFQDLYAQFRRQPFQFAGDEFFTVPTSTRTYTLVAVISYLVSGTA